MKTFHVQRVFNLVSVNRSIRQTANCIVIIAAAGMFSSEASASLIGDEIAISGTSVSFTSPTTATVGSGVEFTATRGDSGGDYFSFDIDFSGAGGLTVLLDGTITRASTAGFAESFTFSGLDSASFDFTGVSLISQEFGGPSDTRPAYVGNITADSFTFYTNNHGACAYGKGCDVGTVIENVIQIEGTQIPEPSIIALFATGLLGLGFARRRRVNLNTL